MAKKSNQARFPVARIKKLIQADDEVGKLSTGTPVVVSKCIELFLADLVGKCVEEAQSKDTKKIAAHTLKHAVLNNALFDFCSDIVEGIPDPLTKDESAPARKRVRTTTGDDEPKKPRVKKTKAPGTKPVEDVKPTAADATDSLPAPPEDAPTPVKKANTNKMALENLLSDPATPKKEEILAAAVPPKTEEEEDDDEWD